jgi:DNA-binding CsgD family transcriptional regulator
VAPTSIDFSALPELMRTLNGPPAVQPREHVAIHSAVLLALRELMRADAVIFNDLAPMRSASWAQSTTLAADNAPAADIDAFYRLFWSSPASHPDRSGDRKTPTALSDFLTIRQWRNSGMYSVLRTNLDFERQLLLPLHGPPGHSRRVRFVRLRGRDFDDTHRAFATLIRPHLAAHLQACTLAGLGTALTNRQRQLVGLLAGGYSNNQIAHALAISPATVRTHLQEIYQRLGVTSRGQAVALLALPEHGTPSGRTESRG